MPARTVRRHLQQHRLSTQRPWFQLSVTFTRDRSAFVNFFNDEPEGEGWRKVVLSDDSRFCLQLYNGRMFVWRYLGERAFHHAIDIVILIHHLE